MMYLNIIGLLMSFMAYSSNASYSNLIDSGAIEADRDDTCTPSGRDCLREPCTDGIYGNYRTNEITFLGVDTTADGCCYSYRSVKTNNDDCEFNNPDQSHFSLDIDCESSFTITTNDPQITYPSDGSTCYNGLKFDKQCGSSTGCEYTVCLTFDNFNGQCCTAPGWYQVKAGTAFAFGETQVPSCNCQSSDCETAGLALREGHVCQCQDECDDAGPYCNTIGFVADRLQDPLVDADLCSGSNKKCCCSCPNCDPYVAPN
eukprot:CAMPEP_0197036372 /NCGR_PEP_ID=MMETSP1384-20130603/13901_1 /TAXON_ID=29189 /ORGANISM="Ammonia sp." /LENGTH=258 /DNA_ID=CAMNT_0042466549 /DNA_START=121 /DNA_END=897 /DNA_ORIENTATION=-